MLRTCPVKRGMDVQRGKRRLYRKGSRQEGKSSKGMSWLRKAWMFAPRLWKGGKCNNAEKREPLGPFAHRKARVQNWLGCYRGEKARRGANVSHHSHFLLINTMWLWRSETCLDFSVLLWKALASGDFFPWTSRQKSCFPPPAPVEWPVLRQDDGPHFTACRK